LSESGSDMQRTGTARQSGARLATAPAALSAPTAMRAPARGGRGPLSTTKGAAPPAPLSLPREATAGAAGGCSGLGSAQCRSQGHNRGCELGCELGCEPGCELGCELGCEPDRLAAAWAACARHSRRTARARSSACRGSSGRHGCSPREERCAKSYIWAKCHSLDRRQQLKVIEHILERTSVA